MNEMRYEKGSITHAEIQRIIKDYYTNKQENFKKKKDTFSGRIQPTKIAP